MTMFINLFLHDFMKVAKNKKLQNENNINNLFEKNKITEGELSDYILAILKDDQSQYFSKSKLQDLYLNEFVFDFLDKNNNNLNKLFSFIPNMKNKDYFYNLFSIHIEPRIFQVLMDKWDFLSSNENFNFIIDSMINVYNKKNISNNLFHYIAENKDLNREKIIEISHIFLLDSNLINKRDDFFNLLKDDIYLQEHIKEQLFCYYTNGTFKNKNTTDFYLDRIDHIVKKVFDNMNNEEIRAFINNIQGNKKNYLGYTPYVRLIDYFFERNLLDLFDSENGKPLIKNFGYLPFKEAKAIIEKIGNDDLLKNELINSYIKNTDFQQIIPLLSYAKDNNIIININIENYKEKILSGFIHFIEDRDINKISKQTSVINSFISFEDNQHSYTHTIYNYLKNKCLHNMNNDFNKINFFVKDILEKCAHVGLELNFELIDKKSLSDLAGSGLYSCLEQIILNDRISKDNLINNHLNNKKRL